MERKRIEYIDIAKGLCVVLMVIGHVGFGLEIKKYIYSFHMPFFFWISGYLYIRKGKKEQSFSQYVEKKFFSLIIPYFSFGFVFFALEAIIKRSIDYGSLFHLLLNNSTGLPINGALWFFTALFFANIIYYIIDVNVNNEIVKIVIIAITSAVGCVLKSRYSINLPWSINPGLVGVGLIYCGSVFKKAQDNITFNKGRNLLFVIVLFIIYIISTSNNTTINMRLSDYGNTILFWLSALTACPLLITITKIGYDYFHDSLFSKYLCNVSTNSVIYICLNRVFITIFKHLIPESFLPKIANRTILLIAVLLSLFVISPIFKLPILSFVIGKSKPWSYRKRLHDNK